MMALALLMFAFAPAPFLSSGTETYELEDWDGFGPVTMRLHRDGRASMTRWNDGRWCKDGGEIRLVMPSNRPTEVCLFEFTFVDEAFAVREVRAGGWYWFIVPSWKKVKP